MKSNNQGASTNVEGEVTIKKLVDDLIQKHLNWHPTNLEMASAKYFTETGKISGSLHIALNQIILKAFSRGVMKGLKENEAGSQETDFSYRTFQSFCDFDGISYDKYQKIFKRFIEPMQKEIEQLSQTSNPMQWVKARIEERMNVLSQIDLVEYPTLYSENETYKKVLGWISESPVSEGNE